MNQCLIERAPSRALGIHAWGIYLDLMQIALKVSRYIENEGYKAHILLPFLSRNSFQKLGEEAGLGRIGVNNLLVTQRHGPRVRLGVIETDMPLVPDSRLKTDIRTFCNECQRCINLCPPGAITQKGFDMFKCVGYFSRTYGCGICLAACPRGESIYVVSNILTSESRVKQKGTKQVK